MCLYCVKVSCAYLCVCLLWDKRDGLVCVFFYNLCVWVRVFCVCVCVCEVCVYVVVHTCNTMSSCV